MHLKTRICHLGVIHNRTEKHGDEDVPAIDVPIEGFALVAEEFNGLLSDPHAHRALFDTSKIPHEPVFQCFKPLALKEKFYDATVTLHLGLARDAVILRQCKLAKVKFNPATGGMVAMAFTSQLRANLDDVPKLLAFQGHEIECDVDVDPSAKPKDVQANLPLGERSDDDPDNDADEQDEAA